MGVRVLGLSASPRAQGNSERLLAAVLAGAEEAGAEVVTVRCRDLDMEGCRECGGCDSTGLCVVRDGMQPLYAMLLDADHVVFASPVFFMGVTSQGKRVIDRCQALWVRRHRLHVDPGRSGRRGLFVATAGDEPGKVLQGARDTVKAFFAEIGVDYWGELAFGHLEGPSDIEAVPRALATARDEGLGLVRGQAPSRGT